MQGEPMKLLLAIDGSETSRHAVAFVVRQRAMFERAEMTCLVIDKPTPLRAVGAFGADPGMPSLASVDVDAIAAPLVQQLKEAGYAPALELREGEPGPEIVQFALDGKFDLIVMGARERGLLRRSVLGSVGRNVLSKSTVPVLLVR
jgi:nucleotide-binding universal stress UspA family protein